jgi:hypothetical protein
VDILTLFEKGKNSPKKFHSNVIWEVLELAKCMLEKKIVGWNCFIVNSNLILLETSCFCSNFRNVGFIMKYVSTSLVKVFGL